MTFSRRRVRALWLALSALGVASWIAGCDAVLGIDEGVLAPDAAIDGGMSTDATLLDAVAVDATFLDVLATDSTVDAQPLLAIAIGRGEAHTCAILQGGILKCWGENDAGELGIGDNSSRGISANDMGNALPAVDLGTGRTALSIAAGLSFTCALLDDHSVKCWGFNMYGELGTGDNQIRGKSPKQMGDNLPAINLGAALGGGAATATAITAGLYHACALLTDGRVKCWGYDAFGQCGNGTTTTAVGVAPNQMGDNLQPVSLGKTAIAISAGGYHSCAILADQSVMCWGYNIDGQLGVGDARNRVGVPPDAGPDAAGALAPVDLGAGVGAVAIGGGYEETCALLVDGGGIKCWGDGLYGTLGQGDTSNRGWDAGQMGDALPVIRLGDASAPSDLGVGGLSGCAVVAEGLKCWGYNQFGELGLENTTTYGNAPNQMGNNLPFVNLGANRSAAFVLAGYHACALLDDGRVKCWGLNGSGQLGLGDTFNRGGGVDQMGDKLQPVNLGTSQ